RRGGGGGPGPGPARGHVAGGLPPGCPPPAARGPARVPPAGGVRSLAPASPLPSQSAFRLWEQRCLANPPARATVSKRTLLPPDRGSSAREAGSPPGLACAPACRHAGNSLGLFRVTR